MAENPKPIFLLGEAMGYEEFKISSGFVGPSGIQLLKMLDEAGLLELTPLDHAHIAKFYQTGNPQWTNTIWKAHPEFYRSNVFQINPPGNKLEFFCGPKSESIPGYGTLLTSKYVRKEFQNELDRLGDELLSVDPNLIICLGNTALWALTGRTGVAKLRGTTQVSTHTVSDFKLLATYHPAAVLRQWEHRPTVIRDFIKAERERHFPDVRRPPCTIRIEPTLADIRTYIDEHIRGTKLLSVDIETSGTRVICIGFAPSTRSAIVIPFDDERTKSGCYWSTPADEKSCWKLVREVLIDSTIPKLFQNGLYDIGFLWRSYGIGVRGATHDTMLLHHSLQPESLKGLAFLGSIYTDHGPWKSERKNNTTIKRDA